MNEYDWKLYSVLRAVAHERMCTRIMTDVEKIVLDKSIAPYERIDASEELLKAGQKSCIGRLACSGFPVMKRARICWGCVRGS